MKFAELGIPGVFLLEIEPHVDERGAFARTFCAREFAAHALPTSFVQTSFSLNTRRGTLRGLHWQASTSAEGKIVRCARGRIHDVAVDIRPQSRTFRQHVGLELSAAAGNALYLPPGVAHGFLTLADDSEVHYAMTEFHAPEAARGARYDDPAFAITWPEEVVVVSDRDLGWPAFGIAADAGAPT